MYSEESDLMGKIYIFGSCSGTEPMPGKNHTSFAIETGDRYYWFDAGECCSITAYNMGIDLMKTRAVFISHCHHDHIGGLCGIIRNITKLNSRYGTLPADGKALLFVPKAELTDAVIGFLNVAGGSAKKYMSFIDPRVIEEGVVFDDGSVKVTAYGNGHVPKENGRFVTYSFKIETEGKTVIFSGDVKAPSDLDSVIENGCDLLLHETGHHKVSDVCEYAETHGAKELLFVHHGREILENYGYFEKYVESRPIKTSLAFDGMVLDF